MDNATLTTVKRIIGVGSLALGLAAVMSPRRFAGHIGLDKSPEMVAAFGARELAAGAALLSPVKPSPFLWTRVIGDAMDLWGLGTAFRAPGAKRNVLMIATGAVLVITVLDILTAAEATPGSLTKNAKGADGRTAGAPAGFSPDREARPPRRPGRCTCESPSSAGR